MSGFSFSTGQRSSDERITQSNARESIFNQDNTIAGLIGLSSEISASDSFLDKRDEVSINRNTA